MLGLVPQLGKNTQGEVYLDGVNLMELNTEQLRRIRGKDIAMIFSGTHQRSESHGQP